MFLDFLEDNPEFDPRQHLAKRHMQMWRNVVMSLNKVGPSRNVDVWVYILHSWRNQIKSKAKKIAFDPMCGLILTNIEQRALEIFQRDNLNISVSPSCNSSVNLDSEGKKTNILARISTIISVFDSRNRLYLKRVSSFAELTIESGSSS